MAYLPTLAETSIGAEGLTLIDAYIGSSPAGPRVIERCPDILRRAAPVVHLVEHNCARLRFSGLGPRLFDELLAGSVSRGRKPPLLL